MTVNLYDLAYNMEQVIRSGSDFQTLENNFREVMEDDSTRNMFEKFRDIQIELQQKQMSGQEISEEEVQNAQQTVAMVQQNPKIAKLMEAEQRMSMVLGDLNRIITKPLEDLYGPQK